MSPKMLSAHHLALSKHIFLNAIIERFFLYAVYSVLLLDRLKKKTSKKHYHDVS